VAAFPLARRFGLDRGFDHYDDALGKAPGVRYEFSERPGTAVVAAALAWLRTQTGPVFLWVHLFEPHAPYEPPAGFAGSDAYRGEVAAADAALSPLISAWDDRGGGVVALLSDHGEAFGEHGMHRHAFELWNVLTQVPLFVRLPGATARRIDVPRSHIDLAPTIVELAGHQVPDDFSGKSLVAELRGETPESRPVLLDLPSDSNNAPRRAIIDGDHKLLLFEDSGKRMLFNLVADPGELHDLAQERPDLFAEISARFETEWKKYPRVRPYGGNRLVGGGTADGPR
jgi:arylsulfatase A-like enzyme